MDAPSFDQILHLEPVEVDIFRGLTPPGAFIGRAIFGGQLIAQAVRAAGLTADDRPCHSLHAYYLRGGDPEHPVDYAVERVRDGAAFSVRSVTASQKGKSILSLTASFKRPEPGLVRQGAMPDVPEPEALDPGVRRAPWEITFGGRPFEIRRATPELPPSLETAAAQRFWFRAAVPFADSPGMHEAALAYVSDYGLISTAMLPHGFVWTGVNAMSTSLDHALWIHHRPNLREWHLFDQRSPCLVDARGLAEGAIWSRDGVLVASTAQETLIREA
jgi:acyl-CoA thioesterase-2